MVLLDGARTIINTCMAVKKGEKVLVLADTLKEQIGQALFQAAQEVRAEPLLVKMLPRKADGEEPPAPIAELMRHADVIIAATEFSLTHTEARRLATRAGARIATLPGVTEEMLSTGGMTADFKEVEKNVKKTYWAVRGCEEVTIKTQLGTDLSLNIKDRPWVTDDTGICKERGKLTNLPAGEIFIAPNEGSANGQLIVDCSFGSKLVQPLKVVIKNGFAEELADKELEKIIAKKGKLGRAVGELGIGMNPNAKIIGNALEDEKVLGTCHLGFGDNFTFGGKIKCGSRLNAVIKNPTLRADGRIILENGKLVV